MKGARLVFSSCEVHLLGERARKNAETAPFNLNNWLPLVDTVWNSVLTYDEGRMLRVKRLIDAINATGGNMTEVTLASIRHATHYARGVTN